jgi:uncharacterized protein YciI
MRLSILASLLFLTILSGEVVAQTANPNYDPKLAAKLGADDYGMKSYIFVILKSGSNASTDKDARNKAFTGHMTNIRRLVDDGKLILAGPFGKNDKDYRGLFLLDVKTLEEANVLLQTDPAINEDYLKAELTEWYGSAAIASYLNDSDKIWKIKP